MIPFAALSFHYKETFEQDIISKSCHDWIIDGKLNDLQRYINILNPSDSNSMYLKNLLHMMKPKKIRKNFSLTDDAYDYCSPCMLTPSIRAANNLQNTTCKDLGFNDENDNGDCVYYINNVNDLENLKFQASNVYQVQFREQIENKKKLEIQKEIEEKKLEKATLDLSQETIKNTEAIKELDVQNNLLKSAQEQHDKLAKLLSTKIGKKQELTNTLYSLQRKIHNLDTLESALNNFESSVDMQFDRSKYLIDIDRARNENIPHKHIYNPLLTDIPATNPPQKSIKVPKYDIRNGKLIEIL